MKASDIALLTAFNRATPSQDTQTGYDESTILRSCRASRRSQIKQLSTTKSTKSKSKADKVQLGKQDTVWSRWKKKATDEQRGRRRGTDRLAQQRVFTKDNGNAPVYKHLCVRVNHTSPSDASLPYGLQVALRHTNLSLSTAAEISNDMLIFTALDHSFAPPTQDTQTAMCDLPSESDTQDTGLHPEITAMSPSAALTPMEGSVEDSLSRLDADPAAEALAEKRRRNGIAQAKVRAKKEMKREVCDTYRSYLYATRSQDGVPSPYSVSVILHQTDPPQPADKITRDMLEFGFLKDGLPLPFGVTPDDDRVTSQISEVGEDGTLFRNQYP